MNKAIAIAAVLMAAASTAIFSTSAYAQGDESETNTEQSIAQKNVGSGESINSNCALNSIDSLAPTCTLLPIKLPPLPGG